MIEVECNISIKKDGVNFLTPLTVNLLHEIMNSGSLRAASKKINISYQHAWNLINEINNAAPNILVEKQRGGEHGGGTQISTYGKKIISDYNNIGFQIQKIVNKINTEINF